MAGNVAGDPTADLLELVHDIVRISGSTSDSRKAVGGGDLFRKDCTDLVRKISLLTHLFEEIRDSTGGSISRSPLEDKWCVDLAAALHAAKRLLSVAFNFDSAASSEGGGKKIAFQFQCVTWKLEKALGKLPYDQFVVSEEVQEQVALVRAQLKRAADKYGPMNSNLLSRSISHPGLEDLISIPSGRAIGTLHIQNIGNVDHEVSATLSPIPKTNASEQRGTDHVIEAPTSSSASLDVCCKDADSNVLSSTNQEIKHSEEDKKPDAQSSEEDKKSDAISVPDDFLCPISLEIMRDPVIVATGQVLFCLSN
ncbi:hypothetical protein SAY86_002268 [Trapa natans]|uniref:U-box domain-containing protein n=1 Tax=Trapa natans TaxID=22666 RepID=A0AAN7LJY8_TRANT|nr:hypothetical protein SAY86_002268 [Trapa natans]